MEKRALAAWLVLTGSMLSGCDPANNPGMFAAGTGIASILFVVVMIIFSLVVTVISVAAPIIIIVMVMKNLNKKKEEKAALLAKGVKATGTILSLGETGTYINNQPMVVIRVHVQPPGQPPFEAKVEQILSQLEIPRVQPGSHVAVSYDPANPSKIAIDLNAPVQVQVFCQYCQKTFPQGSLHCPHCGATAG
jgi:hypothetical protein